MPQGASFLLPRSGRFLPKTAPDGRPEEDLKMVQPLGTKILKSEDNGVLRGRTFRQGKGGDVGIFASRDD